LRGQNDLSGSTSRDAERGDEIVGEMQYEDAYRLACIRGLEVINVGLSQRSSQ
jgi:hypothetical protein